MKIKKSEIIIFIIILLSFAIGVYFYPQMPDKMASHWNSRGQVDSYMSKFWGLFLMPILSVILFLLFAIIPKIDPLKANVEKFKKYFHNFIVILILFLFYIYSLTILWNLGARFNLARLLVPALAVIFYYSGVLTENAERNWFIGIRTPWTLSSDNIWKKTHKRGGKLFKVVAIISLFGVLFPDIAIFFVIFPAIFIVIYIIAYSYFEYQKELKSS